MNRKAWLTSLFWSLSAGAALAILSGERQAISLRIWLATFAVWFAAATVRRMTAAVPMVDHRFQPLIRLRKQGAEIGTSRLRELRNLEVLILRAQANERAFVQQLQPRLIALADHFLPVHHGFSRRSEPERVAELFGTVAWLLDGSVTNRAPTLHELHTFTDVLLPAEPIEEEAA